MSRTILVHQIYRNFDGLAEKHVFYTYFAHFLDKYTTIKRPNTLYTKHVMYLYIYYMAKEGILLGPSIYTPRRSVFTFFG
jgi:hypothetical protein